MSTIEAWAHAWGIHPAALADLQYRLTLASTPEHMSGAGGEAGAQVAVRLAAAQQGVALWRNNVGALQDPTGRWVRYGLCNDSKQLNERIKSGDLIGIRPITVVPSMVGTTIGQFVSREIKAPGWSYRGTGREPAQLAWAELVAGLGGDAGFSTGAL